MQEILFLAWWLYLFCVGQGHVQVLIFVCGCYLCMFRLFVISVGLLLCVVCGLLFVGVLSGARVCGDWLWSALRDWFMFWTVWCFVCVVFLGVSWMLHSMYLCIVWCWSRYILCESSVLVLFYSGLIPQSVWCSCYMKGICILLVALGFSLCPPLVWVVLEELIRPAYPSPTPRNKLRQVWGWININMWATKWRSQ